VGVRADVTFTSRSPRPYSRIASISLHAIRDPGIKRNRRAWLTELFTGDIAMAATDRRSVTFMYSYPAQRRAAVRRIADAVAPLAFDRVYGAWWDRNIAAGAKASSDASGPALSRRDFVKGSPRRVT